MQNALSGVSSRGRQIGRRAGSLHRAATPTVEILERRALLSASTPIAVRVFEAQALPAGEDTQRDPVSAPTSQVVNDSGDPKTADSSRNPQPDPAPKDTGDRDNADTDPADTDPADPEGSSGDSDSGSRTGDSSDGDSSGDGSSDRDPSGNDDNGGGSDHGDTGGPDPGTGSGDTGNPGDSSNGTTDGGDGGSTTAPVDSGGSDGGSTVAGNGDSDGSGSSGTAGGDDGTGGNGNTGSETDTPVDGGSEGSGSRDGDSADPASGDGHTKSHHGDDVAPIATIALPDLPAAGAKSATVTVVYSDNKKVKAKSIGTDDLIITGPGDTLLKVSDVAIDSKGDATRITAIYTVAAPGGSWNHDDNGRYTIKVIDGAVQDVSGNPSGQVSARFAISIAPPPVDETAPSVQLSATDIHSDEDTKIVVDYADAGGIDLATIGPSDLSVEGPGGRSADVGIVDVEANNDRTEVTATYHLTPPGGSWEFGDNGNYTVTVNRGAIADIAGNRVLAADASFTVDCPAPQPIDTGFGNRDSDGGSSDAPADPPPDHAGGGTSSGGTGAGAPIPAGGGSSGGVVNSTEPIEFVAESVITQADGRILLAGHGKAADGSSEALLRRFNADGTLDLSFGNGGTVIGAPGEAWYAVATQGDDRIVVAGTLGGDFAISRYDLSGNLDASFGAAGQTAVDLTGSDDVAYAVAIGADHSIVLAGASGGNAAFARLTADGALDDTFGQHGVNLFDLGSGDDAAAGVAVGADGKIIAAGSTDSQVAVMRLGANGEADTSFSGDGLLLVSDLPATGAVGKVDYSEGIALDPNGRILVANHSASGDFAVTRIDIDGNVDSSFGADGIRTIDMGGDDDADAIVIQQTGEVLVVGTSLNAGAARTAVAALDADGNLITTFGDNGKLLIDTDLSPGAGRELHVGDLVLRAFGARQPDGKLVIGTSNGSTSTSGVATSPLRRLIVPGSQSLPQGSMIGDVGIIDGANQRLEFTDDDGTTISLTIKGGNGTVWKNGNKINLVLNDAGAGLAVTMKTAGGDGRVTLGDVTVSGALKSLKCKTADLTGLFCVTGQIGKLTVGNIAAGTLCAGGSIGSVTAASISGAKVLSGTTLGADAQLGGAGANADRVSAASIGALKISGAISGSIIGAGLDSVDGTYMDDDDRVIGGAQSLIKSIIAKGGVTSSHFVAGAFGSAKTPGKVDVKQDPQFQAL